MKIEFKIIIGVIVLFSITAILLYISSDSPGILKEEYDWQDIEVEKTGIDATLFTTSQKELIGELGGSYIDDFYDNDYVNPGNNPFVFERDWGVERLINRELDSDIDPDVYLFENDDYSYFIASFETPYNYNLNAEDVGFIDIGYSNNFELTCSYTISYIHDSEEYILQNGLLELEEDSTIAIRQNNKKLGFLSTPELIYTITCIMYPTEDNDLGNDMYLDLDLDFFFKINHYMDKVQLGFNEFKVSTAYNEYTVIRKSVVYEGGIQ